MNAKAGRPVGSRAERTKVHVNITIDGDVVEWLQRQVPGSKSSYINSLLRREMKEVGQ